MNALKLVAVNTVRAPVRTVTRVTTQWLPPTSANLSRLKVEIPSGFKQVAPPH